MRKPSASLSHSSTALGITSTSGIPPSGSSMSADKNKAPLKIITVKSSVNGIGWKHAYRSRLLDLVSNVNTLVTHTYAFLKYIFTNELDKNNTFNLSLYTNTDFFREVFLSLTENYKTHKSKTNKTLQSYKDLLLKHRLNYLILSKHRLVKLTYSHQIASYEVVKIDTAYMNGVKTQFGNKLRMLINILLKKKERITKLEAEMKAKKCTPLEIKTAIQTITKQCTKIKLDISSRNIESLKKSAFLDEEAINIITDLFSTYDSKYVFKKNSIYYDVKCDPLKHMKAFYKLSFYCEKLKNKPFNCFPIRTTFIPAHMTIDTLILNTQILKNPVITHLDKENIWGAVVNLQSVAFKKQGPAQDMVFQGIISSDGVSVSILKQNREPRKGGRTKAEPIMRKDCTYIENLSPQKLQEDVGKCVLIDPGRRDLLFCMHENSAFNSKIFYRYTINQKNVETKNRKFRKLRERLKPDSIHAAEDSPSKTKSASVNNGKFVKYIKTRAAVNDTLLKYYSNVSNKKIPPFRKLRLLSFINQRQADHRLAKNLRAKFGKDCVLVIGNWTASNIKFHEPIRGIGVRRMLVDQGFKVYLIDEFKTSSICPTCNGSIETFKNVQNPRPYKRKDYPTVIRHGLLRCVFDQFLLSKYHLTTFHRCTSCKIEKPEYITPRCRLWNRDMAATLNFRHILNNLRKLGKRPERFTRAAAGTTKRPASPSFGIKN